MNLSELKETLHKTLLESLRDEYKEIIYTSRTIETKAQATVAIAGIFIAVAFAYLKENIIKIVLYQKFLLSFGIIFLIVAVVFSIIALKIRSLPAPLTGSLLEAMIKHLLQLSDTDDILEMMPRYINQQIVELKIINKKHDKSNRSKAIYLWIGQLSLMIALILIGSLTLSSIFYKYY